VAGYLAGVGDRHLQNILLDLGTGQLVHIDFG
jgi:DNA-dependent protein kinase catalytic subunit